MRIITAVAIVAAGACPAIAQAETAPAADTPLHKALGAPDDLTIRGSFRMRIEGVDDQFRPAPAASNDAFMSLRTILFAEYHAHRVKIGAELIDSRGYLQKATSSVGTGEVNALELSQAYLAIDLAQALGSGTQSSLTAGRFTMDAGSRRLIARNRFRNTINAFTGARLDWRDADGNSLRLFWTMPQYRLPNQSARIRDNAVVWDRESPDLQFFGGSFTKSGVFGGTLELYGYGLTERDSSRLQTRNRHLFAPGIRFARKASAGRFDYDFEATYQTGHARATSAASDIADLPVSASFFHAEIGRAFAGAWSPRIAVQYDRASGNDSSGSIHRFDTLFGARRGEYGPTSLFGAVQRANLSSPAVRLEVAPDKRWDGFVAWRGLWLVSATDSFGSTGVRDLTGKSGRHAGNQFELRARYWLIPGIARLESGAAILLKGHFLKAAPNAPAQGNTRYGYMDLTFTF